MTADARWTLDALIERYTQHYRRTRGLRDRTLRGYGSFVRLLVEGLCDEPLEAAIPKVAYWRLSALPCSLRDDQSLRDRSRWRVRSA